MPRLYRDLDVYSTINPAQPEKLSVNLHFKAQGSGSPIILIHGLFGSNDNLGLLARQLKENHKVISVDLRNHGLSAHNQHHDYPSMAQDIIALLDQEQISTCSIIGHSMGGKVAMSLCDRIPDLIKKVVIIDIAPVAYSGHHHQNVFNALTALQSEVILSRTQADNVMSHHIEDHGVRQFLLKSLYKRDQNQYQLRFNAPILMQSYDNIMGWQEISPYNKPILFIKGQNSSYLLPEHHSAIQRQFPQAKAHIVAQAGHWVHAEKPDQVSRIILNFLN